MHPMDRERHETNEPRSVDPFDETSQRGLGHGQSVASAPYRDETETLAARRRELEAELGAVRARERDQRRARFTHVGGLAQTACRAAIAVAIGGAVGVVVGVAAVLAVSRGHVELDPHAALTHHRTVVRAIRAARREEIREERARDELVRAVREREAERSAEREVERARSTAVPVVVPSLPVIVPGHEACTGRIEAHVTRLGDDVWDVDRCAVIDAPIASAARFIPHEEDGRVVGLRVYGVRRGGLLAHLGVENGDLLVGVNGHPVTEDPLAAYTSVEGAPRVVIDFVRRGEPMTHTYLVRPNG